MQQSAFRQTHPSGTRLSLAKFSYTTTPIDYPGPLSWNHINGHGDLVSLFDKVAPNESTSSKLIMKVLRNDAILVRPIQPPSLKSFVMQADHTLNMNRNRLILHVSFILLRYRMDLRRNRHLLSSLNRPAWQ